MKIKFYTFPEFKLTENNLSLYTQELEKINNIKIMIFELNDTDFLTRLSFDFWLLSKEKIKDAIADNTILRNEKFLIFDLTSFMESLK